MRNYWNRKQSYNRQNKTKNVSFEKIDKIDRLRLNQPVAERRRESTSYQYQKKGVIARAYTY